MKKTLLILNRLRQIQFDSSVGKLFNQEMQKFFILFSFLLVMSFHSNGQGYALRCNTENSGVTISNDATINPTSALTLEAWVNLSNTSNQAIIHKWSSGNQYTLEIYNGKATFVLHSGGVRFVASPTNFPTNQWVHIAGVFDGSTLKIYENAVLKASINHSGGISVGSGNLTIGKRSDSNSGYVNGGDIDEVRIWNIALNSTEITNNYNKEICSPSSNLVAYYKMSNASGTTLTDDSGNGNNGIITGASWETSGASLVLCNNSNGQGYALRCNTENSGVTISNDATINPTSALTLEAWVNLSNTTNQAIIHKWNSGNQYTLEIYNGKAIFVLHSGGVKFVSSPTNFPTNQWIHIAGVFDGSTLKIYENAVLKASINHSGAISTGTGNLTIGKRSDSNSGYVSGGDIDEVRIWNTALTSTEITNNYNKEICSPPSNLVAYYKMSNASGTTLTDDSGNGNNGIITGASWETSGASLLLCNTPTITSLEEAASITTPGIYNFEIGGNSFDSYVDANGYVQIAVDFGNGSGNLPQSTSLTTGSRGILTPTVLAALTDIQEVRISSSTGEFDVTSSNATIISRIQSNTTLHQGVNDNTINDDWTGTNSIYFTGDATETSIYSTSLHQTAFHPSGFDGFHWCPTHGIQRNTWAGGEVANTTSFQMWLKGGTQTPNIVNIPDANFKAALVNDITINTNSDAEIQYSEAEAVTGTLDVSNKSISELIGIEAFVNLTTLLCNDNSLTSLDISQNTLLEYLHCYGNKLTGLNVSANTALIKLFCYGNKLTGLNVSANTALTVLGCQSNLSLSSLDVSQNTLLTSLTCSNNNLTSLNVSQNTALTALDCQSNSSLTGLNISTNTDLRELYCRGNGLTSLDVSKNIALINLDCANNSLINLGVSQNTVLNYLDCSNNNLTSLDVTNTALTTLSCQNNSSLSTICVNNTHNTSSWNKDAGAEWSTTCGNNIVNIPDANFKSALIDLGVDTNSDGEIQYSEAEAVTGTLDVNDKYIADLTGIEAFVNITTLDCNYNILTSLDVSSNTVLTNIICDGNQLTSLDVSGAISLTYLNCNYNSLTSLDVSGAIALTYLDCTNNSLTSLDVSGAIALTRLECRSNQLTSLDVSSNTTLTDLDCESNPLLTTICISTTHNTTSFYKDASAVWSTACGSNPLTWDGGAGTNVWEDVLNWDREVLPTVSHVAIIPDGTTIKVSQTGAVCKELRVGTSEFEVMIDGEITIAEDIDFQSLASVNVIRGILNLGGNIINDGSASVIFANNSTMNYNGSGAQTISNRDYYNLTLSGSGTKNLTGTVGVKNTFTNSATIGTNTGTMNYNGSGAQTITSFDYHNLTISEDKASNTITFGSTIGIANSLSLTATNVTYDVSTNSTTMNYNGTTQNIGNITGGYYNLACENGTKQFSGQIDVANDFIIKNTAVVQTAGNDLTIGGDFENNGTFTHSPSNIVHFTGTGLSEIKGNITFKRLNINKVNQSVTVSGDVSIDSQGAITFANGTSTLSVTGHLTLLSTGGMHTAKISEIPSGSSVLGNVTIERHIPISTNAFSWWHLTNSVKNVTVQDWQSFFPISGNFAGKNSIDGSLTGASNNWSLKTFEESQVTNGGSFGDGWKNFPTSTHTETFENGQGYRAYIVDTRTSSSIKKLAFTGGINQGDFEFSSGSNANMTYTNSGVTDAEGYAFLGNPYPSAIDFAEDNWTKTNVVDAMYIWDAQIKEWRGWSKSSGSYNGGSSIIPMGQGFWVQVTGTPTLTVKESAKVSNGTVSLQRISQTENNIIVSLEAKDNNDVVTTEIRISDQVTTSYDSEYDMSHLSRNLFSEFNSTPLLDIASQTKEGKKLFVNYLPITAEEIIPLFITTTTGNEYTLTVSKENYSLNSQVYLVDNVLNKEVLVEDIIHYTFDSKLGTKDRFSVKVDNRTVLSTEGFVENGQYLIYPNPATSKGFTVKGTQSYEDVTITVTDVLGNTVYKNTVVNNDSGFEKQVSFDNFIETGIYFVTFTTESTETTQKIVIK